jgi:hypothetical protein
MHQCLIYLLLIRLIYATTYTLYLSRISLYFSINERYDFHASRLLLGFSNVRPRLVTRRNALVAGRCQDE